jgi:hypothetical protein
MMAIQVATYSGKLFKMMAIQVATYSGKLFKKFKVLR